MCGNHYRVEVELGKSLLRDKIHYFERRINRMPQHEREHILHRMNISYQQACNKEMLKAFLIYIYASVSLIEMIQKGFFKVRDYNFPCYGRNDDYLVNYSYIKYSSHAFEAISALVHNSMLKSWIRLSIGSCWLPYIKH